MKKRKLVGGLLMVLGIFSFYWTETHSPDTVLSETSYNLSTPGYIFSLVIATALVVLGARRVFSKSK